MLTDVVETQILGLANRYGRPARWRREYVIPMNHAGWVNKMLKRHGEVVLVVPSSPESVWLHTKGFYPPLLYRLPSGGIHAGESIEDAAVREAYEELGFKAKLTRFLGVVENDMHLHGERGVYPTYVLQTAPLLNQPHVTDPGEQISGFRETSIPGIAQVIDQLVSLGPDWQPWGYFRAAPHALVMIAMKDPR